MATIRKNFRTFAPQQARPKPYTTPLWSDARVVEEARLESV